VHVRGFLLAHCRGLSPSQHALLVPTGRQPKLRTVIRYHSLPPSQGLVDPDTTACPSGCWAAVASFSSRTTQLLKVHAPSKANLCKSPRVSESFKSHACNHVFTQAGDKKKSSFYTLQRVLSCMFRNEQCEPIFMQWKANEVSYLKGIGHIYTLWSVSVFLKCLHLLLILLKLQVNLNYNILQAEHMKNEFKCITWIYIC